MLWLAPVVSEMIEQSESEYAPAHRSTNKSAKHPGRQELPSNFPRVERVLPCTPESARVQTLRQRNSGDRYEESSQLDVEPAKYFVLVTKREKRLAGRVRNSEWFRHRCHTDHREVPGE